MSETILGTPAPVAAPPPEAPAAAPDPREWLPQEYRGDPAFKDYADIGGLAKSHKNAMSMVGLDKGSVLRVPKDEADAAAWDEVFNKLGRPAAPDKYELKAEGIPDASLAAARETFHKLGINGRQAQALLDLYGQTAAQEREASGVGPERLAAVREVSAISAQAAEAQLRQQWGAAYDARIAAATMAYRDVVPPEVSKVLGDLGLNRHPAVVDFLAKLGLERTEASGLKGGGAGGQGAPLTPDQAQRELEAFNNSAEARVLLNRDHPGYVALKAKRDGLLRAAFG
jgi:hypothetical protein